MKKVGPHVVVGSTDLVPHQIRMTDSQTDSQTDRQIQNSLVVDDGNAYIFYEQKKLLKIAI